MFIKTLPVGSFQCNCTILGDPKTGEAIVVDPGDEGDRIVKILSEAKLTVKYLVHTHAHIDHILGTRTVKEKCGGHIGLHKEDLFLYDNMEMQGRVLGLQVVQPALPVDHYLVHGDVLEWGNNRMEVIHTPGHTPGSLSFLVRELIQNQDVLFSGDTLFAGSIGRTDLWGGDYHQIIDSIKSRLLNLEDTVQVVCGHGPMTTIGREKKNNPFLAD